MERWMRGAFGTLMATGIVLTHLAGAPLPLSTSEAPRAAAAEASLCEQMPNLLGAVDWTLRTWPPEQYETDRQNLADLRYFTAMVQADHDWCNRHSESSYTDLMVQTARWNFGNASEALVAYQASVHDVAAFTGTLGPVEKAGTPAPPVSLLSDVRFATHAGFDRVVFEFRDGLPGYRIEYVTPPVTHDASGETVEVAGSAFLRVRLRPATGYDGAADARSYAGPLEFLPGLPSLREFQQTGDFEATVSWVLGLGHQNNFRVMELANPPRLVVDVLHTAS